MKKFIIALVAGFAFIHSAQAIPSNLGQSLIEYEAIVSSPLVTEVIPQSEFIIDIERITKSLTATTLIYQITTLVQKPAHAESHSGVEVELEDEADYDSSRSHRRNSHNKYKVKIKVTPNPQIGPPILTVVSVTPISSHSHRFFEDEVDAE